MADSDELGKGYAFVEAVSKPTEQVSPYERANVVLDVISAPAFDAGRGSERNPKDLAIVRIMSTLNRLQHRFSLGEIAEGDWFNVDFRHSPGDPPAWVLNAAGDYSGPIRRTNLVGMQPLSGEPSTPPQVSLLDALSKLCTSTQAHSPQNSIRRARPLVSKTNYFVRIVDVGHASFSSIHVSRNADSKIVGYFDVGGPVFFHQQTFPKAFAESGRIPDHGFVALSHWDFDHYSLAVTKLTALQQLRWYAPSQPVGPNAARLQSQLGGNLTLLVQPSFQISLGLDLWRGNGPQTDRNSSGYVLTASSQKAQVLLTGDVAYGMIPANARAKLSALGITHHGGSGSGSPPSPINGTGVAAVSYGLPNRYHHPDNANLNAHTSVGWIVTPTFVTPATRGDVWLP